jgi:hypothetical protein
MPIILIGRATPSAIAAPVIAAWMSAVLALALTTLFIALARPRALAAKSFFASAIALPACALGAAALDDSPAGTVLSALGVLSLAVTGAMLAVAALGALVRGVLLIVDRQRRSRGLESTAERAERWLRELPTPTRAVVWVGIMGVLWRLCTWPLLMSNADNGPMRFVESGLQSVMPWINARVDTLIGAGLLAVLVHYLVAGEDSGQGSENSGVIAAPTEPDSRP